MFILKIEGLLEGQIIKRPSKLIKSPYVADAISNNNKFLAHTAALGCCGLCEAGSNILFAPMKNKDDPTKCMYSAQLAVINEKNNEIIIGIHPKLAEELVEKCLTNNYLSILKNVKAYRRETVIFVENKVDSRFDFSGVDENGLPFIMEVKNVPLADYEDISAKDRKNKCYDDLTYNEKIAYFPDGYRKKSADTVSPRALKHIKELTLIKKESKTRCIMCYVIQRTDVNRFQPSVLDSQYREAVKLAVEAGVEIIRLVVQWTKQGEAYFVKDDLCMTPFV